MTQRDSCEGFKEFLNVHSKQKWCYIALKVVHWLVIIFYKKLK